MDLNSDAIASRRPYHCRGHLAKSSIGLLSITVKVCRDPSMHLAKGKQKAAAAPITDRPRDLFNRKCPRGKLISCTLDPHLPERDHWRRSYCAHKAHHECGSAPADLLRVIGRGRATISPNATFEPNAGRIYTARRNWPGLNPRHTSAFPMGS